jgi:hypothetical protein
MWGAAGEQRHLSAKDKAHRLNSPEFFDPLHTRCGSTTENRSSSDLSFSVG